MGTLGKYFLGLTKGFSLVALHSAKAGGVAPGSSQYRINGRRKFLADCSLLMAAGLLPGNLLAVSFAAERASLGMASFSTFRKQVGTRFLVRGCSRSAAPLELISVTELSITRQSLRSTAYEAFSLIFRGTLDAPLEQDIHAFEHPELGRLSMLIVPVISRDVSRRYYQAVFNQLRAT
jgi:hypothetical protein